jgi:hypothetical protein
MGLICTTSQPQFFPPPYMVSRFARADLVVWLSQVQYQSRQYMSNLRLWDDRKKKVVGLSLETVYGKGERPWVNRVGLKDVGLFQEVLCNQLHDLYDFTGHVDAAIEMVKYSMCKSESLTTTVNSTTARMFNWLELPLHTHNDTTLVRMRHLNPSNWIANLVREAGMREYFQGEIAMREYFEKMYFDDIDLYYQVYPELPDPTLSVLHYMATYGRSYTRALCAASETLLREFE